MNPIGEQIVLQTSIQPFHVDSIKIQTAELSDLVNRLLKDGMTEIEIIYYEQSRQGYFLLTATRPL
jgi:hypothetical protein